MRLPVVPVLLVIAIGGLALATTACTEPTPPWVDELIDEFEDEAVASPPREIWRYNYDGETVFYVPPACCDQYGQVYDLRGDVICAPDGGFTGAGDGRCTDFFTASSAKSLEWRDDRAP